MTEDHTFELVLAEERLVPDEGEHVVDDGRRPRRRRLVVAFAGLVMVLGMACVLAAGVTSGSRARSGATLASVELAGVGKPTLNVVVMGHIAGGKSTLVGHMLVRAGVVTAHELNKAEAAAADNGKGHLKYAYLCDKETDERKRGITMHTNVLPLMETDKYRVTFIDVPGSADFATEAKEAFPMADVALLVVPSGTGDFESASRKNGQLREHMLLAYSMGIRQLIVAVNKMDMTQPPYSHERFTEIKREVGGLARSVGFFHRGVAFVPVSAWHGDNLDTTSQKMGWYKGWSTRNRRKTAHGHTLRDAIDAASPKPRDTTSALRMPVKGGKAGEPVLAYIQRGSVSVGTNVQLCPSGTPATVDRLQVGGESSETASAGDVVLASLTTSADTTSGAVAYDESHKCTKVKYFDAQVSVLSNPHPTPCSTVDFTNNFTTTIDVGFQHIPSTWKMLTKMDRRGVVVETNPKHLGAGDRGLVRMYPHVDIDLVVTDKHGGRKMVVTDKRSFADDSWQETSGAGVIMAINAEVDDGPPKGDNSPENEEIPYNPCLKMPQCMDQFNGVEGADMGFSVEYDDEGNKLDDADDAGYFECDGLMVGQETAYPGKGVPNTRDCCPRWTAFGR